MAPESEDEGSREGIAAPLVEELKVPKEEDWGPPALRSLDQLQKEFANRYSQHVAVEKKEKKTRKRSRRNASKNQEVEATETVVGASSMEKEEPQVEEASKDSTIASTDAASGSGEMLADVDSDTSSAFITPASSPRCFCSIASDSEAGSAKQRSCSSNSEEWLEVACTRKSKRVPHKAQPPPKERVQQQVSPWASKAFFMKHEVGIEDDLEFRVVRRLLGPSGENLKHINEEAPGSKVWISGKGSRLSNQPTDSELGSLKICISATSHTTLCEASELVKDLLQAVHEDYRRFWSRHGCMPKEPTVHEASALACTFKVGIEEDTAFRVVHRLLGKSGKNIKRIEAEAPGVTVKICGRRNILQADSKGPLEVHISASTHESFEAATSGVRALLTQVHADYRDFCTQTK